MFDTLLKLSLADLATLARTYGPQLLGALLTLLVGIWLAARVANLLHRALQRAAVDVTLSGFLRNLLYGVLIAVLIVMALQMAGVPSAPLVAALGAGGLAIGLSLQGSLSNLAWGVLLIIFRPFRVGDFIHAGGIEGTVESINLMHTYRVLADQREAVVPNAKIGADPIINANRRGLRRFQVRIGIGYGDDIGQAIAVVQALFDADARILEIPAATVWVDSLDESSVKLLLRAHTRIDDFWPAQTDLLRAVKERFDSAGIRMPFPQREVRVIGMPAPADAAP